jgi:hypothetical protein
MGKQLKKTWETLRDMYRRELKKLHDTKSGEGADTKNELNLNLWKRG